MSLALGLGTDVRNQFWQVVPGNSSVQLQQLKPEAEPSG